MTIQQLREHITVFKYFIFQDCAVIEYYFKTEKKALSLLFDQLKISLFAIGSIDDSELISLKEYTLSQWDALNLAIRHEYELHLESDDNLLDITAAMDKLKNK